MKAAKTEISERRRNFSSSDENPIKPLQPEAPPPVVAFRRRSILKNTTNDGGADEHTNTEQQSSAFSQSKPQCPPPSPKSRPLYPTKNNQRRVSFSTIDISEHPRTLGDNPSVSAGPPITLHWKPQRRRSFDLDVWERHRHQRTNRSTCSSPPYKDDDRRGIHTSIGNPTDQGGPRKFHEMIIPPFERRRMLQEVGFSNREIEEASREARRAREQRRQTIEQFDAEERWGCLYGSMRRTARGLYKGVYKGMSRGIKAVGRSVQKKSVGVRHRRKRSEQLSDVKVRGIRYSHSSHSHSSVSPLDRSEGRRRFLDGSETDGSLDVDPGVENEGAGTDLIAPAQLISQNASQEDIESIDDGSIHCSSNRSIEDENEQIFSRLADVPAETSAVQDLHQHQQQAPKDPLLKLPHHDLRTSQMTHSTISLTAHQSHHDHDLEDPIHGLCDRDEDLISSFSIPTSIKAVGEDHNEEQVASNDILVFDQTQKILDDKTDDLGRSTPTTPPLLQPVIGRRNSFVPASA